MSVEGEIALALVFRPGLIRRAGMAGVAVGIDYQGALALAPPQCDREALAFLLMRAEDGLLAGFRRAENDHGGK
ncbi:hypothetical protein [Methylocystis echinoides]|uniref:hypothetical protein n=1 Tax=Methylocystis echinoides TaxID=29468 RepID=UPI0034231520